jgi:large-conductance mechanosensitive channel
MELVTVAMGQVYLAVIRHFPVSVTPQLLQTCRVTGDIQFQQVTAAVKSTQKRASDSEDFITSVIEFRTRAALSSR